jgi:molybdopterin-guanine dinucleotide biosynthesis protein A
MDAIVLAGGRATRLGGLDKATVTLGGRTSLERVLAALDDAERIVVVGDRRDASADVVWTKEDPPGGGPVAAIAEGLRVTTAELVAVVAVDHPLLRNDDIAMLRQALHGRDGAILVDGHGRDQPLAGVYRSSRLRDAAGALPETAGASVRALVAGLDLARLVNERASLDCDTPEDVERAETMLSGGD